MSVINHLAERVRAIDANPKRLLLELQLGLLIEAATALGMLGLLARQPVAVTVSASLILVFGFLISGSKLFWLAVSPLMLLTGALVYGAISAGFELGGAALPGMDGSWPWYAVAGAVVVFSHMLMWIFSSACQLFERFGEMTAKRRDDEPK